MGVTILSNKSAMRTDELLCGLEDMLLKNAMLMTYDEFGEELGQAHEILAVEMNELLAIIEELKRRTMTSGGADEKGKIR